MLKVLFRCVNVLCPVEECAVLWLANEMQEAMKCPRCQFVMNYQYQELVK